MLISTRRGRRYLQREPGQKHGQGVVLFTVARARNGVLMESANILK